MTLPSLSRLLSLALTSASRRPLGSLLLPVTLAIAIGGCLVPWLNFPFVLLALAPTLGSLPRIALAVARDEPLPRWALFWGFTRYERFLGLFWVPYLVAAGAAIPFVVGLWVDRNLTPDSMQAWVLGLSGAASLGLLFWVLHRYLPAPFSAADLDRELPLTEVLDTAATLLNGRSGAVWLRLSGPVALTILGVWLSPFSLILTFPLLALFAAHLYLSLDDGARKLSGQAPTLR